MLISRKKLRNVLEWIVEFVSQEFSGMVAGLQTEKFDVVISQMTITDERKKQMDFTNRISLTM